MRPTILTYLIDPSAISAFLGVALPDVQVFARRLVENRCWTADGKIAVGADNPNALSVSIGVTDQRLLRRMTKRVGVALRYQRENGLAKSSQGPAT